MRSKMKKVSATCILVSLTLGTAIFTESAKSSEADAFVAIGYAASKKGMSAERGLVIGVLGVWEGAVQGMAWGAAFGGPAGIAAGAIVGL